MTKERFCPNCGSTWVEPDTSNRAMVFFAGGDPNRWECNECGYTGLMPEGDPEEDFEEKEKIDFEASEEVRKVDISFGRGYLKYLIYITLPLAIIYFVSRLIF